MYRIRFKSYNDFFHSRSASLGSLEFFCKYLSGEGFSTFAGPIVFIASLLDFFSCTTVVLNREVYLDMQSVLINILLLFQIWKAETCNIGKTSDVLIIIHSPLKCQTDRQAGRQTYTTGFDLTSEVSRSEIPPWGWGYGCSPVDTPWTQQGSGECRVNGGSGELNALWHKRAVLFAAGRRDLVCLQTRTLGYGCWGANRVAIAIT